MRRLSALLALSLACSAKSSDSAEDDTLEDGFEMGPEICCEAPLQGMARLQEVGIARGLTGALPNTATAIGFEVPGIGGAVTSSDLDADGDLDLLFGGLNAWLDVYINDGQGHFSHIPLPLESSDQGQQLAYATGAVDLTGDLLPELILAMPGRVRILLNEGGLVFSEWATLRPDYGEDSYTYQTVLFGDVDGDLDLDFVLPTMGPEREDPSSPSDIGGPDAVFIQDSPGVFSHATDLWASETGSRVQVGTLSDRDMDGDLDILALSDLGPPSAFWRNDGTVDGVVQWVNDGDDIGAALEIAAMGIDSADLNRDGRLDYCISDVGPPRCLLSDGSGGYVEGAHALGFTIADPIANYVDTVGWSVELADLDNSGWPELIQASGPDPGTWEAQILDIPDVIWWADDQGSWTEQSETSGFSDTANHIGLVSGDFDGNGWLELVVAGPGETPQLYDNACGSESWLSVELIGPPENTEGIGARVSVWSDDLAEIRELGSVRDKAQTASIAHFGLGGRETIDRVQITWPDGHVMETTGAQARRTLTVRHPDAPEIDFAPWTGSYPDIDPIDPDQILVSGSVLSSQNESALEGAQIQDLAGDSTQTDNSGQFHLAVAAESDVDLHLSHTADLVSILLSFESSWQISEPQGLTARMTPTSDYDQLHRAVTSQERDVTLGSVWVSAQSQSEVDLELDGSYEAAVVLSDGFDVGNTLGPDDQVLMFLHVEPGEWNLDAQIEDAGCRGRQTLPVQAGAITTVYLDCTQSP